ncbi:MAG: NAD(P)-dependent oxidoreductase [Nanoarchaeota archaeon]|nr:NAD(P)-dependent oxidoreductase [Nanoarchaeota archaeon]
MSKERILITGGAGYLGNVMTRHFLDQGFQVGCLDNLLYRQDYSIFPLAANPDFEFIHGDVRDKALLERVIPRYDIIIPLAAIVGAPASKARPVDTETVNRDAIITLDQIRSANQRLLFPNTNSGYGTKSGQFECDENTPLEPISLYGTTKCEGEKTLRESSKGGVIFRLASVFGVSPRMRLDLSFHSMVVDALTKKAIVLSEGNFTRNYVYIGDVAQAFAFGIQNYDQMNGEAYNLGSDQANISKNDLAAKVAKHIPGTQLFQHEVERDEDKRNYLVSNDKLRKAGFEAKTSLETGIAEVTRGVSIMLKNNPHKNI